MIPQVMFSRAWRGQSEVTPAMDRASHANYIEHLQSAPSVHPGQGGKHLNLENCPKSSTSTGTPMPPSHRTSDQETIHAYECTHSVKLAGRSLQALDEDDSRLAAHDSVPVTQISDRIAHVLNAGRVANLVLHRLQPRRDRRRHDRQQVARHDA